MFKLTEKERELMAAIISHYLDLQDKVTDDTLRQELFMSVKARKEIKEELAMSDQLMVNYLSTLESKRALSHTPTGWIINPKLIPLKQLTFNFEVKES